MIGKWILIFGVVLMAVGAVIWLVESLGLPLGRLPGDIRMRGDGCSKDGDDPTTASGGWGVGDATRPDATDMMKAGRWVLLPSCQSLSSAVSSLVARRASFHTRTMRGEP